MTQFTGPPKRDLVRALYIAFRSTYPAGIYPAFEAASAATLAPFDAQADVLLSMMTGSMTLRPAPLALPQQSHHSKVLTILHIEAERGVDDAWLAKALGLRTREALDALLAILVADGAVIIGREPPLNPRETWEDEHEPFTIQRCVGNLCSSRRGSGTSWRVPARADSRTTSLPSSSTPRSCSISRGWSSTSRSTC